MLAVSCLVLDVAMPMIIGGVMAITLHLDVLNDRTDRPNPAAFLSGNEPSGTQEGHKAFPQFYVQLQQQRLVSDIHRRRRVKRSRIIKK